MALLRKCLLEVRSRHGDRDTFVGQYPSHLSALLPAQLEAHTCHDPSYAGINETWTHEIESLCSSHYSNPRFTELA